MITATTTLRRTSADLIEIHKHYRFTTAMSRWQELLIPTTIFLPHLHSYNNPLMMNLIIIPSQLHPNDCFYPTTFSLLLCVGTSLQIKTQINLQLMQVNHASANYRCVQTTIISGKKEFANLVSGPGKEPFSTYQVVVIVVCGWIIEADKISLACKRF